MKGFLESTQKTAKSLLSYIYARKQQHILEEYYQYDSISLKLFIEIATKGDVLKICKSGNPDVFKCVDNWEAIVKQNSEENGSYEFGNYFESIKDLSELLERTVFVKTAIMRLMYGYKQELIDELKERGYKINCANSDTYANSLEQNLKRSDHLITKILSKQKEIAGDGKEEKVKAHSFDEIMANLISSLGFVVSDDILLSRYNAYIKMLNKKGRKEEKG